MSNFETSQQPPFYAELYAGFIGLAVLRGTMFTGPLDASQPPGHDGTRTPDGSVAQGHQLTLRNDEIVPSIREHGIDELTIGRYDSTIMGPDTWDERAWVYTHESIGIWKYVTFYKGASGNISIDLLIEADPTDRMTEVSVSKEQMDEIIQDLFDGNDSWLHMEGPLGDFARATHVALIANDEPGPDDIDQLRTILAELQAEAAE